MLTTRNFSVIAAVLVICVLYAGAARGFETHSKPEIVPPDRVMKEVVGRIIRRYFKPGKNVKAIYFSSEGIRPAWLPKIEGIRWVLLTKRQTTHQERKAYFFLKPVIVENKYSIAFALGDGDCNGIGDFWTFEIRDGVLSGLEQPGTVWASFCSTQADAGYSDHLLGSPVPEP